MGTHYFYSARPVDGASFGTTTVGVAVMVSLEVGAGVFVCANTVLMLKKPKSITRPTIT